MNNIMLDIETLANTTNAIVIQVAMQRFDADGNLGESLSVRINGEEQERLGLEKNEETIAWWHRTNVDLLRTLLTEDVLPLYTAVEKIKKFVHWKTDKIWCHATFDAPIVENLFRAAGKRSPWSYMNVRDLRTLVDISGLDLSKFNWDEKKTHDALDDCKFQIEYSVAAIKKLKGESFPQAA